MMAHLKEANVAAVVMGLLIISAIGAPRVTADPGTPLDEFTAYGPPAVSAGVEPTLEPTAVPNGCGALDLQLVVDDTNSMAGAITNVKAGIVDIIEEIRRDSGGNYRLSLISFGDTVHVHEPLADQNGEIVAQQVEALRASGGNNEPEASDLAVKAALEAMPPDGRFLTGKTLVPFRPEATKIVVLATDARPGGVDDEFRDGEDDVSALEASRRAAQLGVKVESVFVPTSGDSANHAVIRKIMRGYADTTGGVYVETGPDGRGTTEAIRDIIEACGSAAAYNQNFREGGAIMDPVLRFLTIFEWLMLVPMLIVFIAAMVMRNTIMHILNNFSKVVNVPIDSMCVKLQDAEDALRKHGCDALARWLDWAYVGRKGDEEPEWRVKPGAWGGWSLILFTPLLALELVLLTADIAFAGLGGAHVLGLSLGVEAGGHQVFGYPVEAVAFALAMVIAPIIFADILLEMHGAGPGAARPLGNAPPDVRQWVKRICIVGIALSALGIATFALYRSELVGLADAEFGTEPGFMVTYLPIIFIPCFALAVPAAAALVFWTIPVGMAACYILGVMALAVIVGLVWRFVVHPLHRIVDRVDATLVSIWDFIARPFTSAFNYFVGGREASFVKQMRKRTIGIIKWDDRPFTDPLCRSRHPDPYEKVGPPECHCKPATYEATKDVVRAAEAAAVGRRQATVLEGPHNGRAASRRP